MAKKYWTFKGQKIPAKKYYPKKQKTVEQQRRDLIRLTGRVNKRITKINQNFKKGSWAIGKLEDRLDVKTNNKKIFVGGKVRIPKNLSETQMKAISKHLESFLGMKTSSVSGIKDVIKQQKKNIQIAFSDEETQISSEEAETLYGLFDDKDSQDLSEYIASSEQQGLVAHATKKNMTRQEFLNMVMMHGIDSSNDADVRRNLNNLYKKFVKPNVKIEENK